MYIFTFIRFFYLYRNLFTNKHSATNEYKRAKKICFAVDLNKIRNTIFFTLNFLKHACIRCNYLLYVRTYVLTTHMYTYIYLYARTYMYS